MSHGGVAGAVHAEVRDAIAWAVISNPARRNALSVRMMAALARTLRRFDEDPGVKVVVLRGAGTEAFAAGADISEFDAQQTTAEERRRADEAIAALFGALEAMRTPAIAMIHGHCVGAGVAVALGADIRIAAADSRFAIPAARLGLGYPLPQVGALVYAVGSAKAAEILFTGDRFSAAEALTTGLVNRVVEAGELEHTVRELAETIARNAPLSVHAAKAAIRATRIDSAPGARVAAEALVAACVGSADAREGQRAFLQKRAPRFTGA